MSKYAVIEVRPGVFHVRPRSLDRRQVKTAPCGCTFIGNAGLRDVQIVQRCDRHKRGGHR